MLEKIITTLIGYIVTGIFGFLVGKVKAIQAENKTQSEAIKNENKIQSIAIESLLRTNMVSTYYRYKKDKKIPYYEKESWYSEFESYTQLGGNSFIKDIKKEIDNWEIGE